MRIVWPMSYLFFKGVSDDIYDSSRHTTRPPPPPAELVVTGDGSSYQGATRKLPNGPVCLGFAYV